MSTGGTRRRVSSEAANLIPSLRKSYAFPQSAIRAAKVTATELIAPSVVGSSTSNTTGTNIDWKKRVRSEYLRILHQKRARRNEVAKAAWIQNNDEVKSKFKNLDFIRSSYEVF